MLYPYHQNSGGGSINDLGTQKHLDDTLQQVDGEVSQLLIENQQAVFGQLGAVDQIHAWPA